MRKETVVTIGVATTVVVVALGWFALSLSSESGTSVSGAAPVAVEVESTFKPAVKDEDVYIESELDSPDGNMSESDDVTRIIVVEPEGDEISSLLSEKVIRNGKIVGK